MMSRRRQKSFKMKYVKYRFQMHSTGCFWKVKQLVDVYTCILVHYTFTFKYDVQNRLYSQAPYSSLNYRYILKRSGARLLSHLLGVADTCHKQRGQLGVRMPAPVHRWIFGCKFLVMPGMQWPGTICRVY